MQVRDVRVHWGREWKLLRTWQHALVRPEVSSSQLLVMPDSWLLMACVAILGHMPSVSFPSTPGSSCRANAQLCACKDICHHAMNAIMHG